MARRTDWYNTAHAPARVEFSRTTSRISRANASTSAAASGRWARGAWRYVFSRVPSTTTLPRSAQRPRAVRGARSAAGQEPALAGRRTYRHVEGDRINLTRAAGPLPLGGRALLVEVVSHGSERLHDGFHAVPEFDTRQVSVQELQAFFFADCCAPRLRELTQVCPQDPAARPAAQAKSVTRTPSMSANLVQPLGKVAVTSTATSACSDRDPVSASRSTRRSSSGCSCTPAGSRRSSRRGGR